jgi:lactobin A/cerein 7B family class IIb bacteriocin
MQVLQDYEIQEVSGGAVDFVIAEDSQRGIVAVGVGISAFGYAFGFGLAFGPSASGGGGKDMYSSFILL